MVFGVGIGLAENDEADDFGCPFGFVTFDSVGNRIQRVETCVSGQCNDEKEKRKFPNRSGRGRFHVQQEARLR